MAIAPVTLTRDMVNSYITSVTSGTRPSDLYITPLARDFIPIMSTTKTPLLKRMGEKSMTVDDYKLVFGEGDIVPKSTTLTEADDGSESVLDVANAKIFQQWDVIRFSTGSERALVIEPPIITSGNAGSIVLQRRYAGVPGAPEAHNSGAGVYVIAPAVPEGADTPLSPYAMGDVDNSWCQIIEYSLQVTHRGRVVPDMEVKTDRVRDMRKKMMTEAMLDIDDLFFWGVPNQGDGTQTNPMTCGGLDYHTSAHTSDLLTDPIELIDIINLLQTTAEDVGAEEMGKSLLSGYKPKRIFNSFFSARRQYQGRGDVNLTDDGFVCDFGHFTWDVNYRLQNLDRIILWNPQDAKRAYFEGGNWTTGFYSVTGWYDHLFLRADMGAMWTGDRKRAKWTNFSLADANYPGLETV